MDSRLSDFFRLARRSKRLGDGTGAVIRFRAYANDRVAAVTIRSGPELLDLLPFESSAGQRGQHRLKLVEQLRANGIGFVRERGNIRARRHFQVFRDILQQILRTSGACCSRLFGRASTWSSSCSWRSHASSARNSATGGRTSGRGVVSGAYLLGLDLFPLAATPQADRDQSNDDGPQLPGHGIFPGKEAGERELLMSLSEPDSEVN